MKMIDTKVKKIDKLVIVKSNTFVLRNIGSDMLKNTKVNDDPNTVDVKSIFREAPEITTVRNATLKLSKSEDNKNFSLSVTETIGDAEWHVENIYNSFNSDSIMSYSDMEKVVDDVASKDGMIVYFSIVVSKTTNDDSVRCVMEQWMKSGDRSVLESMKKYLKPEMYDRFKEGIDRLYNRPMLTENEAMDTLNKSMDKLKGEVEKQLSLCVVPSITEKIATNEYDKFREFAHKLEYYSFIKELLQSISTAVDVIKAETNSSIRNIVDLVLSLPGECNYSYSVSRARWRSCIFDSNVMYINDNVDFDISNIINILEFTKSVYYRSTEDNLNPFEYSINVPCTTSRVLKMHVERIIDNFVSFKTSEFFKNIDLMKEFKAAVQLKLDHHKSPKIDIGSCTIDNISAFVDKRFNRIDALETILLCCENYVDLYNKYKDKEFIPVSVATGHQSIYSSEYLDTCTILAKLAKYLGNNNLYKGLNPILKAIEDVKIKPDNMTYLIGDYFDGSWAYSELSNKKFVDVEKIDESMKTIIKVNKLSDAVISEGVNRLVGQMVYNDDIVKQVREKFNSIEINDANN